VIKWAEPGYLYLLLLIPLIILGLFILYLQKKKALKKFADEGLIPILI